MKKALDFRLLFGFSKFGLVILIIGLVHERFLSEVLINFIQKPREKENDNFSYCPFLAFLSNCLTLLLLHFKKYKTAGLDSS